MAAIDNYKDKLLQAFTGERVPNIGIGDVEWEDILNTEGHKPEDDATLGAAFDINLDGVANTHNIALNAVTSSDFKETVIYLPGTEILQVSLDIRPYNGDVVLFISGIYFSNSNSTTGVSTCIARVKYNGVLLWQGTILQIPTQTGSLMLITLAEKFFNKTNQLNPDTFLVTKNGAFLSTKSGALLVTEKNGYAIDNYTVELEYAATANGNRGRVQHLSVYAQVLKR